MKRTPSIKTSSPFGQVLSEAYQDACHRVKLFMDLLCPGTKNSLDWIFHEPILVDTEGQKELQSTLKHFFNNDNVGDNDANIYLHLLWTPSTMPNTQQVFCK